MHNYYTKNSQIITILLEFRPLLDFFAKISYNDFMVKYVSHFSAAKMWNIPCVDTVFGAELEKRYSVDFTVSEQGARFSDCGKKVHSCELALPTGAVVSRDGIMVASPELIFLQLANKLSLHRLILLGLQLCSHPPGVSSAAVTTKQTLNAFLAKTSGHLGHRKALRAVKYIENGSASIMESLVYMILTLPHFWGGYGLNDAVFNYELPLKCEARLRLGQSRCFTDLYYRKAKVAVEYESFTFHSSPSEQGKEAIRSAILERQGIKMMHLSTIQLYDRAACRDFANNLAARLKKRIRICTKRFDEMHDVLRNLLPDKKTISMFDK